MGSIAFTIYSTGADVEDAFDRAIDDAEEGGGDGDDPGVTLGPDEIPFHGGEDARGVIAEKGTYVVIDHTPVPYRAALALANSLFTSNDPRITFRRGPAGAIAVSPSDDSGTGTADTAGWLFFGWAPC